MVPLVLLIALLLLMVFRWETIATKTVDSGVLKWERDRWTGDIWYSQYTYNKTIRRIPAETMHSSAGYINSHNTLPELTMLASSGYNPMDFWGEGYGVREGYDPRSFWGEDYEEWWDEQIVQWQKEAEIREAREAEIKKRESFIYLKRHTLTAIWWLLLAASAVWLLIEFYRPRRQAPPGT
jgi:hypothetical protein